MKEGFCKKHNIRIFDYCPLCEPGVHEKVLEYLERKGYI